MDFIEELYYGNINPNEKRRNKGSRYAKAIDTVAENEEKLTAALSDDKLKMFIELVNAFDDVGAIDRVESFKIGFRLGIQMMCDSLVRDDSKIFRDIFN